MTKKIAIEIYRRLSAVDQKKVTKAARKWLSSRGIMVTRGSLVYWRNTEMTKSPLDPVYLQAYREALKQEIETVTDNAN